jgi:hypothetical protein
MKQRIKLCAFVATLSIVFAQAASRYEITSESYLAHIKFLASPELKGRLTGTPELNKAADYIAAQFLKAGLQPVAPGGYFEDFQVSATTALSDADALSIQAAAVQKQFKQVIDFIPLNLSGNGTADAALVFAGYGITAPEYHYDDYAGVDVRDKIVIILRHEPQENNEKSVFAGKNLTDHALISSKVVNAKLHGAKAVLLVNDLPNHGGSEDELPRFEPLMATENLAVLVDQVSVRVIDELLADSRESVQSLMTEIDRGLSPHSFVLPKVTAAMTTNLKREQRTVHNVAAYWPGQTDEYVILGAHYDHLGLGEQNSLAPSLIGTVHPGADDNASGTAGVIELARAAAASGVHRRGFLFLCFAGEEEGLLGSAYYAAHPMKPLEKAVAMINMDMIGRLRDNKLYVGGVGTGSTLQPLVEKASAHSGLKTDQSEAGGYGASDHTSFTSRQVPTLFFFSGLHSDYHKPGDTWDKINSPDAVRVLAEVSEIATALADASERPQFVRVAENPHAGGQGDSGGGGYGPYFGSIPDFGGPPHGVRFSDVRDSSPAAKAGLKAGDVLVEFDGKAIDNLYDFTYALRQHKPGDKVRVKVLRDGLPVAAEVLLTKRN